MNRAAYRLALAITLTAAAAAPAIAQSAPPATQPTTQSAATQVAGTDESEMPVGLGIENERIDADGDDSTLDDWGTTLLALAAVVALILALSWVLKRFGRRGGMIPARGDALDVLARRSLSPNHQVFLVRAGPRVLLLGTATNDVRTLAEFTDPDEISRLTAEPSDRPAVSGEGGE